MRRRKLFELNIQEILDIYFDCERPAELYSKHGYRDQHFGKRMADLGLSLSKSKNMFGQDEQELFRQHLFAVLLETGKDIKRTATIFGVTENAIRVHMTKKNLIEPLRAAMESE